MSHDDRVETADGAVARLGPLVHLCGAVIAASAFLPIAPDGRSFFAMLVAEFERGALPGIMMLAGFGSPFLFGIAVAVVALPQLRSLATELVRTPIGLMHGQLLLVAFVVWKSGQAIGAVSLLGFAIVGAIAYARSGSRAPGGHDIGLAHTIRWGAVMIAGVAGWCKLQRMAEVRFGLAVDVLLVTALVLVLASSRFRVQAAE